MMEKHYIYGLVDPVSLLVRYIGKAVNPRLRLVAHLKEIGNSKKCKWIAELARNEQKPMMVILEETNFEQVMAMESKWIGMAIGFGWELVNTIGVPDDHDEVYQDSLKKYAEMYEDRKHLTFPELPVGGAASYNPEYLLDKLKDNFFRPIFQDGNLVMLTKGETPGYAYLVMVENYKGFPHFRSTKHYRNFCIKLSELPLYAVASLPSAIDSQGGNIKYYADIMTAHYRDCPDWYENSISEMEAASVPVTGRTFYAAMG